MKRTTRRTIGMQLLLLLRANPTCMTSSQLSDQTEIGIERIYKALWHLQHRGFAEHVRRRPLGSSVRGKGIAEWSITQAGMDAVDRHLGAAVQLRPGNQQQVAALLEDGFKGGAFAHVLSTVQHRGVDVPHGVAASVFDLAKDAR